MNIPLRAEWENLRNTIKQIELQIASTGSMKPTNQMCRLLISGEDHRFRRHPGVDPVALCRAAWKTFCGSRQGASTIAMQLVRTITGRYERTWRRKLTEMILAILLTFYKGRRQLPVLYLWVAYYGWRMNNFRQACSRLQIDPTIITEFEAAKLIARLKYPEPREECADRSLQIYRRAKHLIALANSDKGNKFRLIRGRNGTVQSCFALKRTH